VKRLIIAALCLLLQVTTLPLSKTQRGAPLPLFGMSDSPEQVQPGESENTGAVFQLPLFLEYIGDGAFEGIGSLEQDSHAESSMVLTVCIPATVSFIGDNAFPPAETVLFVASRGSYAQRWAQEQGYRCVEERIASAPSAELLQILQSVLCCCLLFGFLPPDPQKYRRAAYPVYDSIGRDPKEWPGMRVLELDYP
jgi:hypothetical protein